MCYQHVVLEGLNVELCRAVLCQAHRLIKKPAKTGWVLHSDPPCRQKHMWTAFTQRLTPEVHLTLSSLEGQECNLSRWISAIPVVMGIHSDTNVKVDTKPHAYFIYNCTQTLKPLSYTKKQYIPSMRPTNQQCMTATESRSLKMPVGLIAASLLTKADCQRPAFDICMGLVTRNVGIIHISLTWCMCTVV